ncbi:nuclear transcription factor Y, gamma [Pancytospora epiphaga]|nr:nuclear transcription factor Y, gamma [Pancytospora epiphaga]
MSQKLAMFWHNAIERASTGTLRIKSLKLPLARIKRLMKVEEDVRMVASEVPIMFSLLAEVFVEELTTRAWMNTNEGKRRILQSPDITAAVKTSQMYDFLIYIVPLSEYDRLELQDSELSTQPIFLESQHKGINFNNY